MKDGLPAAGVNDVMQDSRGYIWLATYSGFSKFDGYKFTNYKNNPVSSNSLRNNFVQTIAEDNKGRIWIGHAEGVDIFDPDTEKFLLQWPSSDTAMFGGLKLRIRRDGRLWVCTTHGIYIGDPATLSFEKFSRHPVWTWDILQTRDSAFAIAQSDDGFYYHNPASGQSFRNRHNPENPKSMGPDFFSWCVLEDRSNRIWIGTRGGLELFSPLDSSFTHFMPGVQIIDMLEDEDGQILMASHKGLYKFDPTSKHALLISPMPCASVIRDRQGILWFPSPGGLRQLNTRDKKFELIGSEGFSTISIMEDVDRNIWIYSTKNRAHTIVHKIETLSGKASEYIDIPRHPHSIWSVFRDRDLRLWQVSEGSLETFNEAHESVQHVKTPALVDPIATYMDSRGTLWCGGWSYVARYATASDQLNFLPDFPRSTVYCFLEDPYNNLWIGSSAGLARYELETGRLTVFRNNPQDPESLSNNVVFSLVRTDDGTIWAGTGGGLNKMIKGTENTIPRFANWRTTNSKLPNDDVYAIVDGGDGTLWMTCGNLISHFIPDQNFFRNYDHTDGLLGKEFRGAAHLTGKGIRARDGKIYFGSSDRAIVFHPDSLKENKFVPPVYITGFSVHNQNVPVKGTDADSLEWKTPLERHISATDKIQLDYDQNDLNIEFAALNYLNPERNQYRYRLDPYETEWIQANADNRLARYTNISPGTYTFRVVGSNNDGIWNEEGASLIIVIAPPWWQTRWAYSVYTLLFITMMLMWRKYDNKRIAVKHRAEHLSELDSLKSRFFANISHEFRTPITLILGPLRDLYNGKTKGDPNEVLSPVIRNAQRLHRLINQLLDLSKLEAGKMELRAVPIDIIRFLRELAASYESRAADKKIRYMFFSEVPELIVYIDQEKMESVVHNLLANAFKFTNTGGEIVLNIRQDKDQCHILVNDTGIGIPATEIDKIFDRFHQVDASQTRRYEGTGLGMALAKELVELHKGNISVRSVEGKGTTFTVSLPLGSRHLERTQIAEGGYKTETHQISDIVVVAKTASLSYEDTARGPVILVVEDNADMRNYICKSLSAEYSILEAEDGVSGVKTAEDKIPDLIISDIMMPEMNGYKLCAQVKSNELTSHIPVILLTAKADRESKLSGLETGADDYLSKPFDSDELRLIVRNRIEERRRMRDRFSREITLEPRAITITSMDEQFLSKVLAVIEEHMDDEHFSIEELSREANFSSMHFYRKIKGLTGQTPSAFLRTIRLKRAARLLAENNDNVTQVAYAVGFGSLSYFNKCFKEQFGMTPGQYAETEDATSNNSGGSN